MAKVKFFVNGVRRQLLESEVTREGIRAIDSSNFNVPPEVPICAGDKVVYLHDIADLNSNRIIYNFCQHLKDESGYNHHITGHEDPPAPITFFDFQSSIEDEGRLQNTSTITSNAGKYTDDFTGTDNWVDSDPVNIGVNTTSNVLSFIAQRDSTNDASVFDLGAGNVSDTLWLLRAKFTVSCWVTNATPKYIFFGISTVTQTSSHSTAQDAIGIYFRNQTGASNTTRPIWSDAATLDNTNESLLAWDPSVGTFYIEIKRISTIEMSVEIFSDSGFTTSLIASGTLSLPATVAALRYLTVRNFNLAAGGGSFVGSFDDVQFWSGTTTPTGNPLYTCGKVHCSGVIDTAFCFDGTRRITLNNESYYDFRRDTKWSLGLWVYPTTQSADHMLLAKRNSLTAACTGFNINYNNTCNRYEFQMSNGTTEYTISVGKEFIPLNQWSHIATTYGGNNNMIDMKMFVNGELKSQGNCSAITGDITNGVALTLGGESDGGGLLTGRLDGVHVFDKQLTDDQAISLYYEGAVEFEDGLWEGHSVKFDGVTGHLTVRDQAPEDPRPSNLKLQLKFENTITDSTNTNSSITMGAGSAIYVDGLVDDKSFNFTGASRISINCEANFDNNICSKFTVGFWAKIDSTSSGCDAIISKRTSLCASASGWSISTTSAGVVKFDISNGTTEYSVTGVTNIRDNEWRYITVTKDCSSDSYGMKIYVDGLLDAQGSPVTMTGSSLNDNVLSIGGSVGGGSESKVVLDCVRIWNNELTNTEIQFLHEATFSDIFQKYDIETWVKIPPSVSGNRTIWHKSTCNASGFQLSVNDSSVNGPGFTCSGFTSSGFTLSGGVPVCAVVFRHNTTILTGTSDIVDCDWHHVRVTRNDCNTIKLYVDNILEDSDTDSSNPTDSAKLEFGRNMDNLEHFNGSINTFRWYNGILSDDEIIPLYEKRNPRNNIKFGGFATKVTKEIGRKKVITQSFGKQLGETEVRNVNFNNRSPEYILKTILKDNTDLDTHFHGLDSGVILAEYQADGKVNDIANDLSQLASKVFHTDGLEQFHLHDSTFHVTTAIFDHQINMVNIPTAEDDGELVNDLLIIGENKRFVTSELFSGTGTQTVFNLSENPVTARVETPIGTVKAPEVDYDISTVNKTLTFVTAPASGASNILIEYEFERPLNIRGSKASSIDTYGLKSKRLVLPWITTRNDGIRFIDAYLNTFKDINFRVTMTVPGLVNSIEENDVITVKNSIKGIDDTYIVKGITWKYPKGVTEMTLGEFDFDVLEYSKQIAEKIHDLESAVVRVKDLRDFESIEEILGLTDVFSIDLNQEFMETLSLVDTYTVTEQFDANYDDATAEYDTNDAYD